MSNIIIREQFEKVRYSDGETTVHVVASPFSFLTWVASPIVDIHTELMIDRKFTFYKTNGGIIGVTYDVLNNDFKRFTVTTVEASPEKWVLQLKVWDAWNSISTNVHINFKITEKR